jgi:hypothetical protein
MTAEEKELKGHFDRVDVSEIEPDGNMSYITSWIME